MSYPKFKQGKECAYHKRTDCNYGEGYNRCPYMKYNNLKRITDHDRWHCTFKPNEITDNIQNKEQSYEEDKPNN
jgi:hypothetical protein